MCKKCNHPWGSTKHLWYWQKEWLKRFLTTWYHILNRRAYVKWHNKTYKNRVTLDQIRHVRFMSKSKMDPPDDYIDWMCELDTVQHMNEFGDQ